MGNHDVFTVACRFVPVSLATPKSQTHTRRPRCQRQGLVPDRADPRAEGQVRKATGKDAEAVELSVEELEARIAPSKILPGNK